MDSLPGTVRTSVPWRSREAEAQFFVELLRESRLTLLYGEPGAGKTTLLERQVLPLLRLGFDMDSGRETALIFNDWSEAPLSALSAAIGLQLQATAPAIGQNCLTWSTAMLVDQLEFLGQVHNSRFFLIFDQFERFLEQTAAIGENRAFADAFVDLVTRLSLRVNMLLSMRDAADSAFLARFGGRVSGLADASLRLLPWSHRTLAPTDTAERILPATPAGGRSTRVRGRRATLGHHAHASGDRAAAPIPETLSHVRFYMSRSRAAAPIPEPVSLRARFKSLLKAASIRFGQVNHASLIKIACKLLITSTPGNPLKQVLIDTVRKRVDGSGISDPVTGSTSYTPTGGPMSPAIPLTRPIALAWPKTNENSVPVETSRRTGVDHSVTIPYRTGDVGVPNIRYRRLVRWLSVPVAAAAMLLLLWYPWRLARDSINADRPPRSLPVASVSARTTALPPIVAQTEQGDRLRQIQSRDVRQPLTIFAEADNGSGAIMAADLARWIAPEAGIDLRLLPGNDAIEDLYRLGAAKGDGTALAIVQYDVLRLLRQHALQGDARALSAMQNLRVVAPLQSDEILFIARADSGLRYVHELQGKTISVGPPKSSGSVTATGVYRAMFGDAPKRVAHFSVTEALRKLLDERSIDAIALVGTAPAALLGKQGTTALSSLVLLAVDRDHPASRSGTAAYLPATIRASEHADWLKQDAAGLAVMSFLVTNAHGDTETMGRVGALVKAMCEGQATLRSHGHPKWREVPLGLDLNAGWSVLTVAEGIASDCSVTL